MIACNMVTFKKPPRNKQHLDILLCHFVSYTLYLTLQPSECHPEDSRACPDRCIPKEWWCDGVKDCSNGSDEENCNFTCPPEHFTCSPTACIPLKRRCDGHHDCLFGDGECGHSVLACDIQEMRHTFSLVCICSWLVLTFVFLQACSLIFELI